MYFCIYYLFVMNKDSCLVLKFTLNGSELEIVNEFNYLGILFNRTGNFNKAIKKQPKKLQKQCLKF